jgi:hypothetical protein
MANAVVNESALRELLSEALGNDGAMGYDADPPVVPSAALDRTTLQLDADPVELRHLPKNKNELVIMVRNLLEDVPDDQSGELYKKIKDIFAGDASGVSDFAGGHEVKKNVTPDINQARNLQRDPNKMENKKSISSIIKRIVEDAMGGANPITTAPTAPARGGMDDDLDEADPKDEPKKSVHDLSDQEDDLTDPEVFDPDEVKFVKDDGLEDGPFGDEDEDSAWDPELPGGESDEDDDDDDSEKEKGKRKSRAGLEIGAYGVDGMTLEKIGEELGFTKEAAKKAIETAMERFKVLHTMEPDDRDELVLVGVSDYINMLGKTGEMSEEEEEFMRLHPKVVAMSDNFRDFFSKYVKRAAREQRADTQDDTEL